MSAAIAATIASGGAESVGFLNDIIAQLWPYINVAGCKMTKEIVEPMFKEMLPTPLNSLHFKKIDLGSKPIKFDNIDVYHRAKGVIKLDIDVHWDGECDIELAASLIGSFGVERLKLSGRMSVLLCPLVERMPLVTAMQVGFINTPELSLDFTGVANIADFSLIENSVRKVILKVLSSIIVLPNRLLVKIDPTNNWFDTYQQPIGFLRLTIERGHGFKVPKGFFKDIPDIYVKTKLGVSPTWKTSTKDNDPTPEWNETHDFLLSDQDQRIFIEALDDDLAGDDKIGKGEMTVSELLLAGRSSEIKLLDTNDDGVSTDTGGRICVKCDIMQFVPILSSLSDEENRKEGLCCGMLTVLIAGAKNLPCARREAASFVKVTFGEETMQTPVVVDMPMIDPLNPSYDAVLRVPLTMEKLDTAADIEFELMNKKQKLGTVKIPFNDVVNAEKGTIQNDFEVADGASLSLKVFVLGVTRAE